MKYDLVQAIPVKVIKNKQNSCHPSLVVNNILIHLGKYQNENLSELQF